MSDLKSSHELSLAVHHCTVDSFFALNFPEVIILSPGMVKEIDVSFRPITYENYDDTIYFKLVEDNPNVKTIGFHVPVRAFISTLRVSHAADAAWSGTSGLLTKRRTALAVWSCCPDHCPGGAGLRLLHGQRGVQPHLRARQRGTGASDP